MRSRVGCRDRGRETWVACEWVRCKRAISDGLRQEVSSEKLRVTVISLGFTRTNFAESIGNTEVRARLVEARDTLAMSPDAVARAVLFAIEQPSDVDVGEIVIRPTAQA